MKLSVSMIVKNEAACIARALQSVRDADEIMILDTGSTDRTADVVQATGLPQVRFIFGEYVWCDDFADARNASLARCTGDWALVLDADDWLEPGGIGKIRAACANARRAVRLRMVNATANGTWKSYDMPRVLRLNAGVHFLGADHEAPNADDGGEPAAVMHIGHSPAHVADPDRSLRILTHALAREPHNTRTLYYLAREHYARGQYTVAIPLFTQHVQRSPFPAERADSCLYLARMHWQQSQGETAREWCLRALAINADFREALLFMAEMSFPHNAARWHSFAETATNAGVLFVR